MHAEDQTTTGLIRPKIPEKAEISEKAEKSEKTEKSNLKPPETLKIKSGRSSAPISALDRALTPILTPILKPFKKPKKTRDNTRTLTARAGVIFVNKRLFILFWTPHDLMSRLKSNLNCAIRLQSKVWFLRPFSLTFLG